MNTYAKAWAAGLIDGDGCVTLGKCGRFRRPEIVVDSTDFEILEEFKNLFGGNISPKAKTNERHRQCWHWRINGSLKVMAMGVKILPFMRCRVKKERMRFIIAHWSRVTKANGVYSPDDVARKESFEKGFFEIGAGRGSQARATPTLKPGPM